MAYKTILTVVLDRKTAPDAVAAGVAMARREGGHLDVLCLGVDRTQVGYYYAGANALILQETLDRAQKEAEELTAAVEAILRAEDIAWATETAVVQIAGLSRLVADRAHFADLVVLPKPYGEGRGVEDEAVIEAALFDGHAAVMVVPQKGLGSSAPRRIVIGWNESAEALAAVRRALPILVGAELVDVAIVDPPAHGPDRSDPGGRLSQMLARHGVRAEVSVLARTLPRISDVIARHATDRQADLVVMGAYGHSRFREAILGGATRNMLEQATIPVFMAR